MVDGYEVERALGSIMWGYYSSCKLDAHFGMSVWC